MTPDFLAELTSFLRNAAMNDRPFLGLASPSPGTPFLCCLLIVILIVDPLRCNLSLVCFVVSPSSTCSELVPMTHSFLIGRRPICAPLSPYIFSCFREEVIFYACF